MALSQQKFREIILQVLYSHDLGRPDELLITELMMGELAVTKKNIRLALERVKQVEAKLGEIDQLISSASTSYDFERIQLVTKNILRIGVFELFYDETIPPKVAIAEAIRLSRKFNTPESATFVNALLDHLYQASLGTKSDLCKLLESTKLLLESENVASEVAKEQDLSPEEDHA